MADRRIDPTLLLAEGALISWLGAARAHPPDDRGLEGAKQMGTVLALRWHVASRLGLPAGPFQVWRRWPAEAGRDTTITSQFTDSGTTSLTLAEPVVRAVLTVDGDATVLAFGPGPAEVGLLLDAAVAPPGGGAVTLRGPAIQRFAIVGADFVSLTVESLAEAARDDSWEPLERVGLPYLPGEATYDAKDHGLLSDPSDARTAAAERLRRAAPPMGWPALTPSGRPTPPWQPADPDGLVEEVRELLLRQLASVLDGRAAGTQERFLVRQVINAPRVGGRVALPPSRASYPTLKAALLAAETDFSLALALGLATGYPVGRGDRRLDDVDLMVTGSYDAIPDAGGGGELATVLPWAPLPDLSTVAPAAVAGRHSGPVAPPDPRLPWTTTVSTSWDRVRPTLSLDRPVAAAHGRYDPTLVGPVTDLLAPRASGGPMPLALTSLPTAKDRVGVAESEVALPRDASVVDTGHAVAQSDAFGVWSQWREVEIALPAMPIPVPQPLAATAVVTYAGSPVCVTTAGVDVLIDGTATIPGFVQLSGWLLPAAWAGEPPPPGLNPDAGVPPAGAVVVQANLHESGADGNFEPTPVGSAGLEELPEDGGNGPVPGPPLPPDPPGRRRRWRITFPTVALDYVAQPHWTLALWARETFDGGWSRWSHPAWTSVSSPVPPTVTVVRPPVPPLASVPDAEGRSHVEVPLPVVAGAQSVHVWSLAESTLLPTGMNAALGAPAPSLAQRYASLRAAVDARGSGVRQAFTRQLEVTPGTRFVDVPLPRGSAEIHLFAVTARNAAQVESGWPAGADSMWAAVAPLLVQPVPPVVRAVLADSGDVAVLVETRSLLPLSAVTLHLVRSWDAARDVGSMGPAQRTLIPVLLIEPLPDPSVGPPPAGSLYSAETVLPRSLVEGWKGVYLRAVAHPVERDDQRGMLGRASEPSEVVSLTVPPALGPDLGAAVIGDWGADGLGVVVNFSSAVPLAPTPLGPHTCAGHVSTADGTVIVDLPATAVHLVPVDPAAPPPTAEGPAGVPLLVRTGPRAPAGVPYALWYRRPGVAVPTTVSLVLTDPLGRATVSQLAVPAGPLGPQLELTVTETWPGVAGCTVDFFTPAPVTADAAGSWVLTVHSTGRFGGFPRAVVASFDLATVPLSTDAVVRADAVTVVRFPDGPTHSFRVQVRRRAPQRVTLQLTAPDGTTVETVSQVGGFR